MYPRTPCLRGAALNVSGAEEDCEITAPTLTLNIHTMQSNTLPVPDKIFRRCDTSFG